MLYRNRGETEDKDLVIPNQFKETVLRLNHDVSWSWEGVGGGYTQTRGSFETYDKLVTGE